MTGLRKFNISKPEAAPDRNDIVALTRDAAEVSGITYIMDHDRKEIDKIMSNA